MPQQRLQKIRKRSNHTCERPGRRKKTGVSRGLEQKKNYEIISIHVLLTLFPLSWTSVKTLILWVCVMHELHMLNNITLFPLSPLCQCESSLLWDLNEYLYFPLLRWNSPGFWTVWVAWGWNEENYGDPTMTSTIKKKLPVVVLRTFAPITPDGYLGAAIKRITWSLVYSSNVSIPYRTYGYYLFLNNTKVSRILVFEETSFYKKNRFNFNHEAWQIH